MEDKLDLILNKITSVEYKLDNYIYNLNIDITKILDELSLLNTNIYTIRYEIQSTYDKVKVLNDILNLVHTDTSITLPVSIQEILQDILKQDILLERYDNKMQELSNQLRTIIKQDLGEVVWKKPE